MRCFFARIALAVLASLAFGLPAAQAGDALRLVVPAPAGGNLDHVARVVAERLAVFAGEPVVVENRPGGNTFIAIELVARAAPDGRVLLLAGTGIAFVDLMQKMPLAPLDELAPVIEVAADRYVLVAPDESGWRTVADLEKAAAHSLPGLNCAATPGVGVLACEQVRARFPGKVVVIPFQGVAPGVAALAGGHADFMFAPNESAAPLVAARRLRVLAQSREPTNAADASAPMLARVWPGFLLEGSSGFLVPARTPVERIAQLNAVLARVLADPDVAAQLRRADQSPVGGSPADYALRLRRRREGWGEIIQRLGVGTLR